MKNISITARLLVLIGVALALMAAAMAYKTYVGNIELVSERKTKLAEMNDAALAIVGAFHAQETAGILTREQAQERAIEAVMAMRYGQEGYFWIQDIDAVMIAHPIKPALNGQELADTEDPNGKKLFTEFAETVKAEGAGFVDYFWPKPGFEEPVLKYSHVAGFAPWGWIVGNGVYADDLAAMYTSSILNTLFITGLAAIATLIAAIAIGRSITSPILRLRTVMQAVAEDNTELEVPDTDRRDEIGQMAGALVTLRNAVIERHQLEAQKVQQQRALDEERQANETSQQATARMQASVVSTIGAALERLASGDLTAHVRDLGPEYGKLRDDFNAAVGALRDTIRAIAETTATVEGAAKEINSATDDLSRRTEQQAASLEETAAALDQITSTIQNASERAEEARQMVDEAKKGAAKSGEVVRDAISAMGRIEQSSNKISEIIGVIDDIAFQTNLLALNAGVEAARAGEAGKGFAVVAQEVRELAQRSAKAAKEIKGLITTSTTEVESGVTLVRATGDALAEIEKRVNAINDRISVIATSAREQSAGLREINTAVNQMDHMTQQNAAMVEQTTASSQTLANESVQLTRKLSIFRFQDDTQQPHSAAA